MLFSEIHLTNKYNIYIPGIKRTALITKCQSGTAELIGNHLKHSLLHYNSTTGYSQLRSLLTTVYEKSNLVNFSKLWEMDF